MIFLTVLIVFSSSLATPAIPDTWTHDEVCPSNEPFPDIAKQPPKENALSLYEPMKNRTKRTGASIKFPCEFTGDPKPFYRWYFNGEKQLCDGDRNERIFFNEQPWAHILEIRNLEPKDSGWYKCVAFNTYHKRESSAYLKVKPERANKEVVSRDRRPNSEGKIDPRNPNILGSNINDYNYDENANDDSFAGDAPTCRPYDGETCKDYIGNRTIYSMGNNHYLINERILKDLFGKIRAYPDDKITKDCKKVGLPLLCHYSFPYCDTQQSTPKRPLPIPICKKDCRNIVYGICKKAFEEAKKLNIERHIKLPNCHPLPENTPHCTSIRNLQQVSTKTLAFTFPTNGIVSPIPTVFDEGVDITQYIPYRQVVPEHSCYNGTGMNYYGTVSKTTDGEECSNWHSAFAEHNYCRNPLGQKAMPWCLVQSLSDGPSLKFCAISQCPGSGLIDPTSHDDENNQKKDNSTRELLVILIPSISVPLALALFLMLFCFCHNGNCLKKSARRYTGNNGVNRGMTGIRMVNGTILAPKLVTAQTPKMTTANIRELAEANLKLLQIREITRSSLRAVCELGEGAFGKVIQADLIELITNDNAGGPGSTITGSGPNGEHQETRPLLSTLVAIKMLKSEASTQMQIDLRREAELMSKLKHPNISCLIGICSRDNGPLCLVYELMPHGDLHQFLINRASAATGAPSKQELGDVLAGEKNRLPPTASARLEHSDRLHIATQLASGMEYLSAHRFIHRDLATRNAMVGDHLSVKICDLGIARSRYPADYSHAGDNLYLPVRWMPPESVIYGKFTIESDVWAFGVCLWEIWSDGMQPYYRYSNAEVLDMIRRRQILPPPSSVVIGECTSSMYQLMQDCWNENPQHRPAFKDLFGSLNTWRNEAVMQQRHSGGTDRSSTDPKTNTTGLTNLSTSVQQNPIGTPGSMTTNNSYYHSRKGPSGATSQTEYPRSILGGPNNVYGSHSPMLPINLNNMHGYLNPHVMNPYAAAPLSTNSSRLYPSAAYSEITGASSTLSGLGPHYRPPHLASPSFFGGDSQTAAVERQETQSMTTISSPDPSYYNAPNRPPQSHFPAPPILPYNRQLIPMENLIPPPQPSLASTTTETNLQNQYTTNPYENTRSAPNSIIDHHLPLYPSATRNSNLHENGDDMNSSMSEDDSLSSNSLASPPNNDNKTRTLSTQQFKNSPSVASNQIANQQKSSLGNQYSPHRNKDNFPTACVIPTIPPPPVKPSRTQSPRRIKNNSYKQGSLRRTQRNGEGGATTSSSEMSGQQLIYHSSNNNGESQEQPFLLQQNVTTNKVTLNDSGFSQRDGGGIEKENNSSRLMKTHLVRQHSGSDSYQSDNSEQSDIKDR